MQRADRKGEGLYEIWRGTQGKVSEESEEATEAMKEGVVRNLEGQRESETNEERLERRAGWCGRDGWDP